MVTYRDIDEGLPVPRFATEPFLGELEFSVVTLVASDERYERLLSSFAAKGFGPENTEFVAIDNREGNRLDGYQALRAVIPGLRGRYILLTHDDIELLHDDATDLRDQIAALDALDPNWMIAGNAGGLRRQRVLHIDDPVGHFELESKTPVPVEALDENFLVMPRIRAPLASLDLSGFHLFATDMCVQARMAGGNVYVIPFMLRHHSRGRIDALYLSSLNAIERKYSRLGISGRFTSPAGTCYFGMRGAAMKLADTVHESTKAVSARVKRKLGSGLTGRRT